jgi:hypothetical protein
MIIIDSIKKYFARQREQERKAREIAARYDMLHAYEESRRHGETPLQALEEWDLILPEERKYFV